MEIHEMQNKNEWQDFAISFAMSQFLHSWQWGEFQERLGHKIFRLAILEDRRETNKIESKFQILGTILIIKMPLPLGKSYLYCPRGPILKKNNIETIKIFFEEIKEIAKKEKSIFLRLEPLSQLPVINYQLRRVRDFQPSKTLLIDLTNSEQEILAAMHPKTRYNIRLAEKKGITIRQGKGEKDIKTFIKLTRETAERDNFKAHASSHYQKLLNLDQNFVKLYLAEYQGKVLAANLIIYFGDTCTYSHGASSNEYKNLMAPHLLYWHCIQEAKKSGYKYYDFWGIDEKKWPGVTRFKKSFVNEKTGLEISYPGTFDLVLDKKWYYLYSLAKKFLRP